MTSGNTVLVRLAAGGLLTALTAAAGAQMTTIEWAAPVDGNWNEMARWIPMRAPSDPGDLPSFGHASPYTVTLNVDRLIAGVSISNPGVTLRVMSSFAPTTLAFSDGAYYSCNGLVILDDGPGTTDQVRLMLPDGLEMTGTGELRLARDAEVTIAAGGEVANFHRIAGAGVINGAGATLVNGGELIADTPAARLLVLPYTQNYHRMRAVSGGILRVVDVRQQGGTQSPGIAWIEADGGAFELMNEISTGGLRLVHGASFTLPDGDGLLTSVFIEGELALRPAETAPITSLTLASFCNNGGLIRLMGDATTHRRVRLVLNPYMTLFGGRGHEGIGCTLEETDDTELYCKGPAGNGQRLSGVGTVAGDPGAYLLSAGTIAPGLPLGTLKVRIPLTLDPRGTVEIELGGSGPGQYDILEATILPVSIAGELAVSLVDGFEMPPCTPVTILKGVVSGAFEKLTLPPMPQGRLSVMYGPAGVSLLYIPGDLTGDGQLDFADYLEFLNLYDARDLGADLNGDGFVDFTDYLEFLNLYDAGC